VVARKPPAEASKTGVCPTTHFDCKLQDLRDLLQVQIDDINQHLMELRKDSVNQIEHTSLRDFLEIKLNAIDTATRLASDAINVRLEGMNEFRNSLKDQNATMVSRVEFISVRSVFDADIRMLRESKAALDGKASMASVLGSYAVAFVSLIVTVVIGVVHIVMMR
jgi:hypothetical protein